MITAKNFVKHTEGIQGYAFTFHHQIAEMMKGFAIMHVEEALRLASVEACVTTMRQPMDDDLISVVDKGSILNAYPKSLIK